jgi:large subunit ribosomal protein L31
VKGDHGGAAEQQHGEAAAKLARGAGLALGGLSGFHWWSYRHESADSQPWNSRLRESSRLKGVKSGIHPEYTLANVHCSCGNQFYTRSTQADLHVELCSECHPFYTGKQKLVDTGGRVERFQRRAAKHAKAGR